MISGGDKPPKKIKEKMSIEKRNKLQTEWVSRRDALIVKLQDKFPKKFDEKIFETAIISCIHSIKARFPDVKITLVLYDYHTHQMPKISKLHDDELCVNFYVKNKTDDRSSLGLAKNIGENATILSNDRFRDWTEKEYPGIYDELVKDNLVGGFNFKKIRGNAERYEFSCPDLVQRLKSLKRNA